MAACDRVKVMALTNEEFESALKHLPRRLAAKNVEIARAILVQGRRQVDLVKESGLRSAVAALVRKVRQAHEKHGTPPAGWVRVSVCVPVDMAPIVKAIDTRYINRLINQRVEHMKIVTVSNQKVALASPLQRFIWLWRCAKRVCVSSLLTLIRKRTRRRPLPYPGAL